MALCYPYGPEELEALVRDTGGYWRRDVIGVSQGGRPIHRLCNRCSDDPQREPGLYLVGRQHAGETPGSWVLDGLMRRMAEHGDRAPRVWCVPLADIDGVVRGDYGKDAFPHDLNRAWGNPPMRHETLVISRDMHLWASRCTPRLVLDFHAPGIGEREGMYVFASPHDEPGRMHPQAGPWVDALARAAGALGSPRFCRKPTHAGRWRGELDLSGFSAATFDVPTLVLECSYALAGESVLTVTGYQSLGTRLADALIAHLDRSI